MITLKSGQEVKIVGGSKKSITGTANFTVKAVYPELTMEQLLTSAGLAALRQRTNKTFKVTKKDLNFDSEDELYVAIGYKK